MRCSNSSFEREVCSDTGLPHETRKISNKGINKRGTKNNICGRKEIIKIREEINKIKTEKPIENINTIKSWFFEKTNKINIFSMAHHEEKRMSDKQNK